MMVEKNASVGNTPLPLATALWAADVKKLMSLADTTLRPLSLMNRSSPAPEICALVKPTSFQMAVCTSPKLYWPPYLASDVKFCDSSQLIWSTWVCDIELKPMGTNDAAVLPAIFSALYVVGDRLMLMSGFRQ